MILYKYTADCSKLNPEQEDATKEGHESLYSRRSDIAEWNSGDGTVNFTQPTVQKRSFSL